MHEEVAWWRDLARRAKDSEVLSERKRQIAEAKVERLERLLRFEEWDDGDQEPRYLVEMRNARNKARAWKALAKKLRGQVRDLRRVNFQLRTWGDR